MELTRYDDVVAYLGVIGPYLTEREAEHNLLLGILGTLRDQPDVYREPAFLGVVRDGAHILLAAIRTPPFGLVLSEPAGDDASAGAAIDTLVAALARSDPGLPGVLGPSAVVAGFAARWAQVTGLRSRLQMAERIYRLSTVRPPPWPGGRWRFARSTDRRLLLAWVAAFQAEALPEEAARPDAEAMVDRWIRRNGRTAYLWEVDGAVVSLVVAGSSTPTGVRIGPVYTPPPWRGRGFASALTAAASQDQLGSGRRFCFLFTDLANPTSNSIYQRIGYEPVADVDQYAFAEDVPLGVDRRDDRDGAGGER